MWMGSSGAPPAPPPLRAVYVDALNFARLLYFCDDNGGSVGASDGAEDAAAVVGSPAALRAAGARAAAFAAAARRSGLRAVAFVDLACVSEEARAKRRARRERGVREAARGVPHAAPQLLCEMLDAAGAGAPLMAYAEVERALLAAAAARTSERPLSLLFRRLPAAALSDIARAQHGSEEDPAPSPSPASAGSAAASASASAAAMAAAGGAAAVADADAGAEAEAGSSWSSVVPDGASDLAGLVPEDIVAAVRAALGLELGHVAGAGGAHAATWVFAVMSPQDARALVRETHSNRLPVAGASGAQARGVGFALGPLIRLGNPAAESV